MTSCLLIEWAESSNIIEYVQIWFQFPHDFRKVKNLSPSIAFNGIKFYVFQPNSSYLHMSLLRE